MPPLVSCTHSQESRRARPLSVRAGVLASALLLAVGCTEQLPTVPAVQDPVRPAFNISPGDGPIIGTDRQDYAPGETVLILGWGWSAGETVRLQVVHVEGGDNAEAEHQPWNITADGDGEVSSSWVIPLDGDEGGATLKLTADGQTSGAHAEVLFTDLIGTVALYVDTPGGTSQTAYPWGATIYPRITGAQVGTCYRLRWSNPSASVVQTTSAVATSSTHDPSTFTVPATGPSGTWSLVVDQNTSGSCVSSFSSATNPINFDVARAVVVGAGTTASDATGGDRCVFLGSAPPGAGCGTATDQTFWVRSLSTGNARAFLRFDLSAAIGAAPTAGAVVTDAKVRLTVAGTPASARTYNIERAASTWSEGTITYATQPATTGPVNTASVLTTLTPGAGGGDPQTWVQWTVTANVQTFVDDATTNHGWRISDATEGASPGVQSRFNTTEHVCTGGTTCKRTWPVLLIDWVDPPKLAFVTTAKTGQVGQCLGPIRVQSQTSGGSPLAVGADLTVNLSTANLGTGGAGSFFSNSTCTTAATTATITSGNTNSSDFYYRATGRGDGGHDVVASATNYTPDASQTQTINRATTSLLYTGDLIVLSGSTLNLSAVLSSAFEGCVAGKTISWRITPDPTDGVGFLQLSSSTTNASGVATQTTSTTGWPEDIYEIDAFMVDNDPNCLPIKDEAALAVLTPGNAATGGGFLAGSAVGGGRVNFGFNVRPIPGSDPIAYKGQALIMKTQEWRCKGPLTVYGTTGTPVVNVAGGTCDFQIWDPTADGGLGDWVVAPDGEDRPFSIQFVDNGTGRGRDAPPPDRFGFQISGITPNPSFALADIKGGNIDVKTGGTTTTTTTGGGGKKK